MVGDFAALYTRDVDRLEMSSSVSMDGPDATGRAGNSESTFHWMQAHIESSQLKFRHKSDVAAISA